MTHEERKEVRVWKEEVERAYRRGFAQGACAALEAAYGQYPTDYRDTPTIKRSQQYLEEWFARITKWRFSQSGGRIFWPEWPGREEKRGPLSGRIRGEMGEHQTPLECL
jgi:hypothetical protein